MANQRLVKSIHLVVYFIFIVSTTFFNFNDARFLIRPRLHNLMELDWPTEPRNDEISYTNSFTMPPFASLPPHTFTTRTPPPTLPSKPDRSLNPPVPSLSPSAHSPSPTKHDSNLSPSAHFPSTNQPVSSPRLPSTHRPPPAPLPHHKKPPHEVGIWCVAKPTLPDSLIQDALDYACGSGADCESIEPNGPCFKPNTVYAHASFAFNSYWQESKAVGGTCEFGGTAMLVNVDPSYGDCYFISK